MSFCLFVVSNGFKKKESESLVDISSNVWVGVKMRQGSNFLCMYMYACEVQNFIEFATKYSNSLINTQFLTFRGKVLD